MNRFFSTVNFFVLYFSLELDLAGVKFACDLHSVKIGCLLEQYLRFRAFVATLIRRVAFDALLTVLDDGNWPPQIIKIAHFKSSVDLT